ncbi:MAG TPA: hypothetical protein VMR86_20645 [Myxococcota bacterium]|nr:hypothetical protein [Myxococcota bacterium]
MKLLLAAVLVLAASSLPATALACDSCIAASSSAVQWAFITASIFLSVTPLVVVGGFVWWLVRRARRMAAEEATGVIHLPTSPARASRQP